MNDQDIHGIIAAYKDIRDVTRLGSEDASALARAAHTALRQSPEWKSRNVAPDLLQFAEVLVNDIRNKRLPPSPIAHLHLLSFFKESRSFDRGSQFWSWLVEQHDEYVNPAVYGAAIELFAVQGKPEEETEGLYMQALKRFPGTFNEYHLSPGGIVPDRTQPVAMRGLPMTLLQGIVTARLLRGDSRSAYLGLDTALRLYPTQVPSRFFAMFIQERPISEAYKTLVLACRSGAVVGQDAVAMLLTRLRKLAEDAPIVNGFATRAMITSTYAYVAAGGTPAPSHLTELVMAIASIAHDPKLLMLKEVEVRDVGERLLLALRQLINIFSYKGVRPTTTTFNVMITNIAGRGKQEDVVRIALNDIQALGLKPTAITYRAILTASGEIANADLLKTAWSNLVDLREASGSQPEYSDWTILANASVKCDAKDYVHEQLARLAHAVNKGTSDRVAGILSAKQPSNKEAETSGSDQQDVRPVELLLDEIESDLAVFGDRMIDAETLDRVFQGGLLPMTLGQPAVYMSKAEDEKLRQVYDQLTSASDYEQTARDSTLEPAMSSTGLPLDELRYRNWSTINELLAESEGQDAVFSRAVQGAIAQGIAPPKRGHGLEGISPVSIGLGCEQQIDEHQDQVTWQIRSKNSQDILRLRGS